MKTYRLVAAGLLAGLAILLQFYNNAVGLQTGFGMTVDLVGVPVLIAFFVLGFESALEVLVVLALAIALIAQTGYVGAIMKFAATLPMLAVPAVYALAFKKRFDSLKATAIVLFGSLAAILLFAFLSYPTVFAASAAGSLRVWEIYLIGVVPIALIAIVSYALYWLLRKCESSTEVASKLSFKHHALAALSLAVLVRGFAMIVANAFFAGPLFFKIPPHEYIAFIESQKILLFGAGASWFTVIFFWNAVQGALEYAVAWIIAFKFGFARKYGSLQAHGV